MWQRADTCSCIPLREGESENSWTVEVAGIPSRAPIGTDFLFVQEKNLDLQGLKQVHFLDLFRLGQKEGFLFKDFLGEG